MHKRPGSTKGVSRRGNDRLPPPQTCPHCGGAVAFVSNAEVYGRAFGDWPWLYLCQNDQCRAYVSTHPGTKIPLGTLATAELRSARTIAKEQFNQLWQSGQMSRDAAYGWLASKLNIPVAACHFSWFDAAQCRQAMTELAALKRPVARTEQAAKAFAEWRALLAAKAKPTR